MNRSITRDQIMAAGNMKPDAIFGGLQETGMILRSQTADGASFSAQRRLFPKVIVDEIGSESYNGTIHTMSKGSQGSWTTDTTPCFQHIKHEATLLPAAWQRGKPT